MSKDEYLITDAPLKALTVFAMISFVPSIILVNKGFPIGAYLYFGVAFFGAISASGSPNAIDTNSGDKKSITKEQLNEILKPENLVIQTSSVPLTYTSECKENLIQNNFTISNCWTRNSKNTAVSAITNVYQWVENNNADFYTVEATLDYRGLAPRTSLISFFIDKRYFQSIKAGNWKVQDKTLCHLEIPENRWSEFAYQEGAGFRGFAVRGFCGENSICSTLSKTQNVEFWIEAPH